MAAVTPELLPYRVLTGEAADDLAARLRQADSAVYRRSPAAALKEHLTPAEFRRFGDKLNKDGSRSGVSNIIQTALGDLEKRPVIDIRLAFAPRQSFIEEIVSWLETRVPRPVIVRFHPSNSITAGVIVGYNGKIFDYSIDKHLEI
jgi:F0F1-type ATP synthase delta subunit